MDSRPTRQTDSLTEQLNKWGVCEEMRLETGGEFRVWLGHGIFSTYCRFLSFYSNIETNVQFLMSILNTRCVQSMYDQVYFWKKNLKNTFRNPSLLLLGFGPPTQDTGRQIWGKIKLERQRKRQIWNTKSMKREKDKKQREGCFSRIYQTYCKQMEWWIMGEKLDILLKYYWKSNIKKASSRI